MTTLSPTAQLAEFASTLRLSDLSEEARDAARWGMLDAVACAIAGTDEHVATCVRDWVRADRPAGPCTVWGTEQTSSPAGAALANATAAHALDFDDVCWAMNAHASAVLAPAALVLGEAAGASGADVLRAYCAGFEVAARIGEALGRSHYEAGWHPTATIGVLGATAVAGVLLGLNAVAFTHALGIACSEAAGTRMNFGTDTKPLHAGLAAQAGIAAAELASRGVTARADGIEAHMGFAELYQGRSARVRIDRERACLVDPGIEHKPYPSCRFTHRIIEGVARLRERNPGRSLESLTCTMDPFARRILIYPRANTALEAKFSLFWCAALTWLDGPPTVETFRDERVRQADVAQVAGRILVVDGSMDCETVEAVFDDGTRDAETVTLPLGHPLRPLSREQHLQKVRACMQPRLGSERAHRVMPLLERIDDCSNVRDVLAELRAR